MFIDSKNIFTRVYDPADVQHNRQNYAEYISFWQVIGRNYEEIANNDYFGAKLKIARDPNCPLHVLEKLSSKFDMWINMNLCANVSTPIELKNAIRDLTFMLYC